MGKAIGAYERLLSCGPSRLDTWLQGGEPLTASEQRGAALFVGKAKCSSCHSGPYMSDQQFHNVGLKPTVVATVFLDDGDVGAAAGLAAMSSDPLSVHGKFSDGDDKRGAVPLGASLQGAFRTPTLRCVAGRPSFMHTGQLLSLGDVVAFFDRGGDAAGYPGTNELKPLGLSVDERSDLTAFLGALSGPGPSAQLMHAP
jgi:cytochrome c peroxidase